MPLEPKDTIAAVATPPGRGGIGIVRISGPAVRTIAVAVLGSLPRPRHAAFAGFLDDSGVPIDQGLALFFPAPHSFTGEDVLELHGHGGPVVLDLLLRRLIALGSRLARPGEFSERAFLNGKLDLSQAEAVADLIESGSEDAARSALRSLQGLFSARVKRLTEALTELRVYVEAAIDFPEEEIDFLDEERIVTRLTAIRRDMDALLESARQGCLLRDGMTVAIAGRPNAGKSSLLNALAEADAAIVSTVPGTTRDVIREQIQLDGMPVHLVDTAGLGVTGDPLAGEGVRRARAAIVRADRVLVLVDDSVPAAAAELPVLLNELPPGVPYTVIRNKIDLSGRRPGGVETDAGLEVALSAKTGSGLEALRAHLKACMGLRPAGAATFIARRRHLDAIQRALAHVDTGQRQLTEYRAGELLAEDLRQAQQALGEVTGEFTSEDLLARIFSSFCIGK